MACLAAVLLANSTERHFSSIRILEFGRPNGRCAEDDTEDRAREARNRGLKWDDGWGMPRIRRRKSRRA